MALQLLIDDYIHFLVESEQMNYDSRTLRTTMTPSFDNLMRLEYIQERMQELYEQMIVIGLRVHQSELDNILRKRMHVTKVFA